MYVYIIYTHTYINIYNSVILALSERGNRDQPKF